MAVARAAAIPVVPATDLFSRSAWLYAFLRERIFRDDTGHIERALWPDGAVPSGAVLLEVGCGPGVYGRKLAARQPGLRAVGVDRSTVLLQRAEALAERAGVVNCWFEQGDALALDWPDASVDAVVASRLFTVVDGVMALAEMHRVLRPGGRCFVAEPASLLGTLAPMALLRLVGLFAMPGEAPPWPHRNTATEFAALVQSQAWESVEITAADGYHYAVCQKIGAERG